MERRGWNSHSCADPRLVKNALPVSHVSYEEASELAYFGAQVLHPIAMQPALHANIPVRVKNSYNPSVMSAILVEWLLRLHVKGISL